MAKVNVHDSSKLVPDHWADKDFVAEMDDRYREYQSGKAKLISLEDVEKKGRKMARKLKSKS